MPSRSMRAGVIAFAILALTLTGCVETPVPTPTPTTSGSASPMPEPDPEIDLEGSADDNLAYFDLVNRQLMDEGGVLEGRDFIDNLVAVGYPKSDMEVTPDNTAIGILADNIQFAIRLNGTCLIGQYGNVGYQSTTGALLSTGRCLVGQTRPIDW